MAVDQNESVLLTGASGFIGRHLIEVLKERYTIFALARRSRKEAGVAPHPNLNWLLVDITDEQELDRTFREILETHERIDYIFHFAAYYDFGDQVYSDTYERTNVTATRRILELSRECDPRRFVFASSVVASEFPAPGDLVYEGSVLDARFPYAITKKKGEDLVREFSTFFPCTIVRLAAVFSDWCEYEPLYRQLSVWLSKNWKSRLFVGKEGVSIPYIHIFNVTCLLKSIIARSTDLKPFDILLASPDRPTSLLDIHRKAMQFFFGKDREPVHLPIWAAKGGLLARDTVGRLRGKRPFERMWMLRYIDREFPVDSSYTREILRWSLKERFQIENRILYVIENLKSGPMEWHRRNQVRIRRFRTERSALVLGQELSSLRDQVVDEVFDYLTAPRRKSIFPYYQSLDPGRLRYFIDRQFGNLCTSVRHGDRSVMIGFAHDLAKVRYGEDVNLGEIVAAMKATQSIITHRLYEEPRLESMKMLVHDNIALAIQLAIDEIENTYDQLELVHEKV